MIRLFGDSHANVVRKALEGQAPSPIKATMLEVGRLFLKRFHKVAGGQIVFTQTKMAKRFQKAMGAAALQPGERCYISLGLHGIAFFHAKSWANLTINMDRDDRQFISQSAFRVAVLNFNKHIFNFLADCQANGIEVVVVAAPYLHAAYYKSKKARPMSEAEYYEIDYQYRLIVTAKLTEMGIKIILPPPECYKGGFLMPKYCRDTGNDYHGNDLYGARVAEQILAFEDTGVASGLEPPVRR